MAEDRAQELIEKLRDFRTRSAARSQLTAMGREAVGPLLEALEQGSQKGARWTILDCLGDLGAEEAIPVIAAYLDDPGYQTVAYDALVKITGRDLGLVPEGWLKWVRKEGKAVPRAEGELPDKELLELTLEESGAQWSEEAEGRYVIELPVGKRRTRQVTVVFGGEDHEHSPIVIVYANCGEASPEHYETVLRNNLRMPYGAVALRDIGGKPYFVMFNTILREALGPTELRKSIVSVGERAERVERQLSG